jgi:hypothetical protein
MAPWRKVMALFVSDLSDLENHGILMRPRGEADWSTSATPTILRRDLFLIEFRSRLRMTSAAAENARQLMSESEHEKPLSARTPSTPGRTSLHFARETRMEILTYHTSQALIHLTTLPDSSISTIGAGKPRRRVRREHN